MYVGSPPVITSRQVPYGQTATLDCNVQGGSTRFTIRWERVNGRLPPNSFPSGSTLEIRDVVNDDEGRYHCIATSQDGQRLDAYVDLTVIGKYCVCMSWRRLLC